MVIGAYAALTGPIAYQAKYLNLIIYLCADDGKSALGNLS